MIWQFNFCPDWPIHFLGDKKLKWHGCEEGDRAKCSFQRMLSEMRDTEWNANAIWQLAEWQSTYYPQNECLMRVERWHLRTTWDVGVTLMLSCAFHSLIWMKCYQPAPFPVYCSAPFRTHLGGFLKPWRSISDKADNYIQFEKKEETQEAK